MHGTFTSLIHEVERVVAAPYVPSLQNLYDITSDISPAEVRSWASCKPCQVTLLVDVLVEALPQSSIVLELLSIFGAAPVIRNTLLERYPSILDKFLEQSVGHGGSKYISLCISLLSPPLLDKFLAPARLAPFIIKLVGRLAENPCEGTISPLYKVIAGLQGTSRALNEVPQETMSDIQIELKKALHNLDDHMGSLLSLAIFARIAKADIRYGREPPAWLTSVQHFFGSKRGLKTLDLVFMRTILACSAGYNSLGPRRAAESIRLAIEICDNIDTDRRRAWAQGNSTKVTKLCEKVARDGIDLEVQMMGVTFLMCVLPVALPPEIPRFGLHGLISMSSRRVLEAVPPELVSRLVEATAISVGEPVIYSYLNYILSTLEAEFSSDSDAITSVKLAEIFLSGLRNLKPRSLGVEVRELASSLGKEATLLLLERFPRRPSEQCSGSLTCYAELSTAWNHLFIGFFEFCFLPSGLDNISTALETEAFAALVVRAQKSLSINKCTFLEAKSPDVMDSFPLDSAREGSPTKNRKCDWKARVAETVTTSAHDLHRNIVRQIQEICYDFENCGFEKETPLRVTEEERDKLSLELEDLKRQKLELENRMRQMSDTISRLQPEVVRWKACSEDAVVCNTELSTKLKKTRAELEEQRLSSEEMTRKQNEGARAKELDLIATITGKKDEIEVLQREINQLRTENSDLRFALDSVQKEKAAALESAVSLREDTVKLERIIESQKTSVVEMEESIQQLLAERGGVKKDSEALRAKLNETTIELDELKFNISETRKCARDELEATKKRYELEVFNTRAMCMKREEENKFLQDSMQAAALDAEQELQSKEEKIQRLERKVQSLQDERTVTVREFSEAQQHMGRLMKVMGLQWDTSESKSPTKDQPALRLRPTLYSSVGDIHTQPDASPVTRPKDSLGASLASITPRHHRSDRKVNVPPIRTAAEQVQKRKPLGETDCNSPLKPWHQGATVKSNAPGGLKENQKPRPEDYAHSAVLDRDMELLEELSLTSTFFSDENGLSESFYS